MKCFKALLLFVALYFISIPVFACGNEYYVMRTSVPYVKGKLDLSSLLQRKDDYMPYWAHGFVWGEGDGVDDRYAFVEEIKKKAKIETDDNLSFSWSQIQQVLNKKVDYKLLSDYAWNELRLGNKKNAVRLLEALYKDHPNEYNVVANLGTAYEVTGKDKEALELLKKAVAINPQSHYGSEWIHIGILEQKISKNPNYKLILDLKADGSSYNKEIVPDSLMVQLAYQLHERIGFVPSPDPIVGQLVKDFGDLVAFIHSASRAKEFYAFAWNYDSTVAPVTLLKKDNKAEEKDRSSNEKKSSGYLIYIIGGVVLLSVAGYFLMRRKKTMS